MAHRTAHELRAEAAEFREMAANGSDLHLQDALRLVADEFEREAATIEAPECEDPEQE